MKRWLSKARTIVATATVTSAAWLIGGAIWLQHERQDSAPQASQPMRMVADRAPRGMKSPADAGEARGSARGGLAMPVLGVRPGELADTFTQARAGGRRVHDAIDIMAPRGTPVIAAAAGEIEKLFISEEGGKTVYVRSPDRKLIYYYAHLDAYAPGLAEKQQVRAGQRLGTVGFSGNANPSAPHLHFAVMRTSPEAAWWAKAEQLNPYPLLTAP